VLEESGRWDGVSPSSVDDSVPTIVGSTSVVARGSPSDTSSGVLIGSGLMVSGDETGVSTAVAVDDESGGVVSGVLRLGVSPLVG
jgi:hypothetical protein